MITLLLQEMLSKLSPFGKSSVSMLIGMFNVKTEEIDRDAEILVNAIGDRRIDDVNEFCESKNIDKNSIGYRVIMRLCGIDEISNSV